MLRKIRGFKRNEVTGGWRRLHNKEFNNLCFVKPSFDQIKAKETGGPCGSVGDRTGVYRDLMGRPE